LTIGGVLIIVLLVPVKGFSQKPDTSFQSTRNKPRVQRAHSPTKAALFSAVLPGMGQVYNKKYWKVPIIYAGGGFVYYLYDYYNRNYNNFSNAYSAFLNEKIDEYRNLTTEESLKAAKDFYRRYRDLNVIIMVGVYLANIIDATVDAYLFNFDVSRDLSLRPAAIRSGNYHTVPGLRLTYQF